MNDWRTAQLGAVAELLNGDRGKNYPSQSFRVATGVPFINAGHLDGGRVRLEGMDYISEEHFARLRGGKVQRDDLLLCIRGSLGRIAIATDDVVPSTIASSLVIIRPGADADPRFLLAVLSSPWGRQKLQASDNGAAQPNVGARDVAQFEIPVPPFPTQRKIAAILSAYDDLIENNTRRIELLEKMSQLIYREWFVEFRYPGHEEVPLVDSDFGLIPQGWTVSPLRESVELLYGKALKADDRAHGNVPVFGSGGSVGFHDRALVDGPGIVVGRKGNVGSVMWSHTSFFPIDTTYYVKTQLPMTYTFFGLGRLDFIDSHAAVPGLSREQAYALPWVRPDGEVLSKFDQLATAWFGLKDCLERTNNELRATRDLLLPRLISGEIAVENLDIRVSEAA